MVSTKPVFGSVEIPESILPSSTIPRGSAVGSDDSVPATSMDAQLFENGMPVADIFVQTDLSKTKSEAKRLIKQGGGYINGERIAAFDQTIQRSDFKDAEIAYQDGLEAAKKTRDLPKQVMRLTNIATLNQDQGDFDKALNK